MAHPIRQTFSQNLLNDYEGLKRYLHGEEDLAAIQAQSKHPQLEEFSPPGLGRVIFKGFLTSPLALLTTADSLAIYLLNVIGLRSIASFIHVASYHVFKEGSDYALRGWCKSTILISGRNYPKMEASDVYMCPDIPSSQITDPRIRLRTQVHVAVGSDIGFYQYTFHVKILRVCFRKGYVFQIPVVF